LSLLDVSERQLGRELMDDPSLDEERHRAALRGLGRINRISRTASSIWPVIPELATNLDRPLRVLDLATGGGDVPIALARGARRAGLALDIIGCDVSPAAIDHACEQARRHDVAVDFIPIDVLRDPLPRDYDLLTCGLFLHHLSRDEVTEVLGRMAGAAGRCVLVSDLLRGAIGMLLAAVAPRLLTRSRIVHVDAVKSVRAAFTLDEARRLATEAGMPDARFTVRWPMRYVMRWDKP